MKTKKVLYWILPFLLVPIIIQVLRLIVAPNIVFFQNNWEERYESQREGITWKKYNEFKKSIKINSDLINTDPFGKGKLKISEKYNKFYSIGPDRVDNFLEVIYDPTNGVFSSGDIEVKQYRGESH